MKEVVVRKSELVEALKKNKNIHIKKYNKATIDFKNLVIKGLEKNLKLAKEKGVLKTNLDLPVSPPLNYAESYDEAIGMLELSIEDTVLLDRDNYRRYYTDKWEWSRAFNATVSGCTTLVNSIDRVV